METFKEGVKWKAEGVLFHAVALKLPAPSAMILNMFKDGHNTLYPVSQLYFSSIFSCFIQVGCFT